jgi:enoyl-CoA hydratase/carnithine racemase
MSTIDLQTKYLEAEVRDRVLRVRINRPHKRNATTQDMYRGLKRAAVIADGDPELDAMLLTGTDEWFGCGGDMSGEMEHPEALNAELDHSEHFPFRHLAQCRKVIVAAVNGLCHAGGLDLALHCDVIVASDRATFRVPELLRGVPEPWLAARLAAYVGLAKAKYLLFTAAPIDAAEAERIGLVGAVVPHEELGEHVEWVLEQIRLTGPRARMLVKDEMNRNIPQADMNIFRRELMSPEMAEGMMAFLEKRPPRWPR